MYKQLYGKKYKECLFITTFNNYGGSHITKLAINMNYEKATGPPLLPAYYDSNW